MSFSAYESSRQRGTPATLYFFRWGSATNAYFAYTDAEQIVSHMGIEYRPVPITRGEIVASGTLDKSALELRMPVSLELPEMFLAYPPSRVVTCTIRQGHLNDPDLEFLVVWAGRIVNSKREDNEAILTGEPVSTSMRRTGLRRHYQYSCPHVLYGSHCRANEAAATISAVVATVGPASVTMPSDWATFEDRDNFIGGMVRWLFQGNPEIRTILRIDDAKLTLELSGITRGLSPGANVDVIRGCDRQMSGCNMHNNIQNFGGFPWIPKKNPIGTLNQYY